MIRRDDVVIFPCTNGEADEIFRAYYWMPRIRRSRRLSYSVFYRGDKVGWLQCADVFGTKLARGLEKFQTGETLELARGFFVDSTPSNIESCAIGMVVRKVANDWFAQFGIVKKLAIIYQDLDVGQRGVVYAASGFVRMGECVGARHYHSPVRSNVRGKKAVWARVFRPLNGKHYKVQLA